MPFQCLLSVQTLSHWLAPIEQMASSQGSEMQYWWRRVEETKPKWTQLRDICREAGVEVMYTIIQSLTADGRDQSLDYKISGFHVPPGSFDAEVGPVLLAFMTQHAASQARGKLLWCCLGQQSLSYSVPTTGAGMHRARS